MPTEQWLACGRRGVPTDADIWANCDVKRTSGRGIYPKGSALGWFTACLVYRRLYEKEKLAVWRHATCGDTHMQLALYPNACALLGGGDGPNY
jgi:hypothetical protein